MIQFFRPPAYLTPSSISLRYRRSRCTRRARQAYARGERGLNLHRRISLAGLASSESYFFRGKTSTRGPDHYITSHRTAEVITGLGVPSLPVVGGREAKARNSLTTVSTEGVVDSGVEQKGKTREARKRETHAREAARKNMWHSRACMKERT